jgi:hypothetical protein
MAQVSGEIIPEPKVVDAEVCPESWRDRLFERRVQWRSRAHKEAFYRAVYTPKWVGADFAVPEMIVIRHI